MTDFVKAQVREDALALIDTLMNDFDFDTFLNGECSFWEWSEPRYSVLHEYGYETYSGASRYVIGHDDADFVIKFATDEGEELDYCANEVYIYEKAVESGVDAIFAPCCFVDRIAGYNFYAMMKCNCDSDSFYDNSCDIQYRLWCEERGLNPDVSENREDFWNEDGDYDGQSALFDLAREYWPEEFVQRVINFCNDYEVNDCHSGNWGWYDDMPVIVDYAGYGECARSIQRWRQAESRLSYLEVSSDEEN